MESIKKAITDSKHIIFIQLPCSYCENHHPQPLDLFEKQYQVDIEYGIETKKGFIRAETISYQDFIEFKGEAGAKSAGKLRTEGVDYLVKDGDIMHFLFNV